MLITGKHIMDVSTSLGGGGVVGFLVLFCLGQQSKYTKLLSLLAYLKKKIGSDFLPWALDSAMFVKTKWGKS